MTLKEYRDSRKRRWYRVSRKLVIGGLVLGTLLAISAVLVGQLARAEDNAPIPAMDGRMQDMMVMMQNTAAWTPQGLVVLQGNRLLHYSPTLVLLHTVALPTPKTPASVPVGMPPSGEILADVAPDEMAPRQSRISARILPATDGLIIVRGQQVIWLDSKFNLAGQVLLPELPPMTPDELAAIYPVDQPMMPGRGKQMKRPASPEIPEAGDESSPRELKAK